MEILKQKCSVDIFLVSNYTKKQVVSSSDNKNSNWKMILLISRETGQISILETLDYFDSMCPAITEFSLFTDEKIKA